MRHQRKIDKIVALHPDLAQKTIRIESKPIEFTSTSSHKFVPIKIDTDKLDSLLIAYSSIQNNPSLPSEESVPKSNEIKELIIQEIIPEINETLELDIPFTINGEKYNLSIETNVDYSKDGLSMSLASDSLGVTYEAEYHETNVKVKVNKFKPWGWIAIVLALFILEREFKLGTMGLKLARKLLFPI
jgi:hypothetical protein